MQAPTSESREGSSPVVVRATAAALRGQHPRLYSLPGWQRAGLSLVARLPQFVTRALVEWDQSRAGIDPAQADAIRVETAARACLSEYDGLAGPFEAVVTGAALGGAAAHLALALGGPFLPQPFIFSFRAGSPANNVREYFENGSRLARTILEHNPEVAVVNHFDPIHDGWLTTYVNHIRLKLISLPAAYAEFIRQRLRPGGAIVFLDCAAPWRQYRIGPRHTFQVGGWGGLSDAYFIERWPLDAKPPAAGGERLRPEASSRGSARGAQPEGVFSPPLETRPESEWGTEPGLRESVRAFAEREGYRFRPISFDHPNTYSRLAFAANQALARKEGREPQGVLVEMFTHIDPWAVRAARLLPLWLIFNTTDSCEFLRRMTGRFPPGKPILFAPLATYSLTPDLAAWEAWARALDGRDWRVMGARPSRWPSDAPSMWRHSRDIARFCAAHPDPVRAHLSAEEMAALADEAAAETWTWPL